MCVVSMVMEHYLDKWQQPDPRFTNPFPSIGVGVIPSTPWPPPARPPVNMPTQAEVDEFHRLLARARKYDAEHNEPDCELEEKRQLLLKLAKELGVELQLTPAAKESTP